MNNDLPALPVAIIGAGPIGLAAAAHLLERGFTPMVFEAGATIASSFESFRHVQLFSPWRYNVDPAARRLLEANGWTMPPEDELPTAGAIVDRYLAPLAALKAVAATLRLSHRVVGISREGFDKVKSTGRADAPFVIRAVIPAKIPAVIPAKIPAVIPAKAGIQADGSRDPDWIPASAGMTVEFRAWAVLDATGTWTKSNPLGANGLPAIGELEAAEHFAYGMPDILGRFRDRYAGKRVLVAGAGHSAAGSLLALAKLAEAAPGTEIVWTIRGHNFARIFGGGENDGLPARGALGGRLKALADGGRMKVEADFFTTGVRRTRDGLVVEGRGTKGEARRIEGIDEIVVATGGRPDLSLFSELRVKLDAWIESTEQLAPLIDPNVHSCGTVRPHGHRELAHPEPRFYAVGAKSYGRAPNFLLATGHEQVRSVVAALSGDLAAADDVRLELPETGVCSTQFDEASSGCCTTGEEKLVAETAKASERSSCAPSGCGAPKPAVEKARAKSSCCGGPPTSRTDACCVKDEKAKNAGEAGCGCATSPAHEIGQVVSRAEG